MELNDKKEAQILKDISAGKYRDCYLVYIRKSTDEPDNQKNSIVYQKSENIKFTQREKLPVAPIAITGLCVDGVISEKHSGFKEDNDLTFTKDGLVQYHIDRPKFQKLVQFLSLGLFRGIVCLCWDRISRNKGDDTLIRKLMRKGIDVRFVYANYDKTSAGALHMDIDGMFAEHHSRVTSEKVRLTTWNLRERGVVTYKAPIGYLNQGSMEHKPFDPDRAPIIKRFFEYYATGEWSLADLVRFANQQGLSSIPVRRRRTHDEMLAEESDEIAIEKVSRPLTISYIHKILTNPFYTGRVLGNESKYVPSVSHEALVEDEVYNNVQKMLKRKKVSLFYTQKLQLPLRGMVRCGDCGRVYTPYLQKGIQYFGARCAPTCANPKKSFNIKFLEQEVGKFIDRLSFTENEKIQLDSTTSTDISLFEEKRLKRIEESDRRKKKIRENLTYLRTNKLNLLKSGVYTPEMMLQEETTLNTQLNAIQDEEIISDLSMQAVMEDVLKLSELLEKGSDYYSNAKSPEKELVIKTIFSELYISENTLRYKCKNGFKALENRKLLVCIPTDWLSELLRLGPLLKISLDELRSIMNPKAL
ncbi:MAG: recombinase family protein [Formivibrio sp.]|nr:recombinase family protein [Formivibrio sp.]